MIFYRYFRGYPFYGSGILLPTTDADIVIYDYGDSFPMDHEIDFDFILYVCSNSIWHRYKTLKTGISYLGLSNHLKIICNMGQKNTLHQLAKYFANPVFYYPYDTDAFLVDAKKMSFVTNLLQLKRRNRLFFLLKNYLFPKR